MNELPGGEVAGSGHEAVEPPLPSCCFVIKSEELLALNYLPEDHVVPSHIEWIDRGTDRHLSPSRLEQLLRTYHRADPSPSVLKLRDAAGLRAVFPDEGERNAFARQFEAGRQQEVSDRERLVTGIYASLENAEAAVSAMLDDGVPKDAIAMLWRANQFIDGSAASPEGYSRRRVFMNVSAGGAIAAALGVAVLALPGIGPVAAAGALATAAYSSVATASGIIGATGAAMATMLTDLDVDEYAANHREELLKRGRIFLSVDVLASGRSRQEIRKFLEQTEARPV